MRQVSGSSIGSSVSSYSYYFVENGGTPNTNGRDVVDFLDEAMSDEEPSPEPVKHQPSPRKPSPRKPSPRKTAPERRERRRSSRKNSPAGMFSVDQYR